MHSGQSEHHPLSVMSMMGLAMLPFFIGQQPPGQHQQAERHHGIDLLEAHVCFISNIESLANTCSTNDRKIQKTKPSHGSLWLPSGERLLAAMGPATPTVRQTVDNRSNHAASSFFISFHCGTGIGALSCKANLNPGCIADRPSAQPAFPSPWPPVRLPAPRPAPRGPRAIRCCR